MGFLKWLDGFLSDDLRRALPEELGRARLLAGAAIALVMVNGLVTTVILVTGLPWIYAIGGSSTLAGYVVTLWSLRKASSSRPAALLLSGIMASGVILTSRYANDPSLSAHAVGMLITVLTVFLLGPRMGLRRSWPPALAAALWLRASSPHPWL